MHNLALYFLGTPRIEVDGTAVKRTPRKAIALLAYLATTETAPRRETLLMLLWPDLDRQRGLAALRTTLSALRKALGGEWVQTEGDTVSLADGFTCDLYQFQQQLAIANEPDLADERRVEALKTAVSLYHDTFIAGFTLADTVTFDDWQLNQTEAYQHKIADALRDLCQILTKQHQWEPALPYAQQWVALDSLHEPAIRQFMLALASGGYISSAIRHFRRFKQRLRDELDILPEPETLDLYDRIRAEKPVQSSSTAVSAHHSLLPFIGRQAEIATINAWLDDANGRLLTLIGVGGAGKTRLALEVARLGKRPSVFVPLAPVTDPEFLIGAIAQALNFSFYGQGTPQTQLIEYLREKTLLLVLDNLEQLLPGAPQLLDILLNAPGIKILATSRERLYLRGEQIIEVGGLPYPVQITSKSSGVTSLDVTSLDVTSLDVASLDAVTFFNEVATRLLRRFDLSQALPDVVQICQLVDGLPLAIELAAAWVRVMSCAEIAAEIEKNLDFLATSLQDVPQRHRSLRAIFQHSWDLLRIDSQQLFQQLSVFRGGFQFEAAKQITNTTLPQLAALMDKSLLHRNPSGRYSMPMGLHPFAGEALHAQPLVETAVRNAHATYYANLVRSHTQGLRGGGQKVGLTAVNTELDNILAAWQWAAVQQDEQTCHKMSDGLYLFFEMRNLFQEGADLFKSVAAWENGLSDPYMRRMQMRAMARQGHFMHRLGQQDEAKQLLQKSVDIARMLHSEVDIAFALNSLGYIAWRQSAYEQAESHYRESLRLYRRAADLWGVSQVLNNLAILPQNMSETKRLLTESLAITRQIGDLWGEVRALNNLGIVVQDREEARALYQACLRICREIDNQFLMTFPLINLGHSARLIGEFATAQGYYLESLNRCREIGYRAGAARSLAQLGTVAYQIGQYAEANRYCTEGFDIAEAIGDRRSVGLLRYIMGNIELVSGTAVSAKTTFHHSLNTFRDVLDKQGEGWPLLGLAQVALDEQDWQQVQGHAEAALAVFTAVNDQTGIAAALALLGVSSHDETAIPHFKQALQIATSLSALPLIFDVLFNLAVWHKKQNYLTEAWRIVRFIGGQETAVSAHIRYRTNQLQNDLHNLTVDAIPDILPTQSLEQFLQTLNL